LEWLVLGAAGSTARRSVGGLACWTHHRGGHGGHGGRSSLPTQQVALAAPAGGGALLSPAGRAGGCQPDIPRVFSEGSRAACAFSSTSLIGAHDRRRGALRCVPAAAWVLRCQGWERARPSDCGGTGANQVVAEHASLVRSLLFSTAFATPSVTVQVLRCVAEGDLPTLSLHPSLPRPVTAAPLHCCHRSWGSPRGGPSRRRCENSCRCPCYRHPIATAAAAAAVAAAAASLRPFLPLSPLPYPAGGRYGESEPGPCAGARELGPTFGSSPSSSSSVSLKSCVARVLCRSCPVSLVSCPVRVLSRSSHLSVLLCRSSPRLV
jgi:hypothetical protein